MMDRKMPRDFRFNFYSSIGLMPDHKYKAVLAERHRNLALLRDMVLRVGVPQSCRPEVWRLLLGIESHHADCWPFLVQQLTEQYTSLQQFARLSGLYVQPTLPNSPTAKQTQRVRAVECMALELVYQHIRRYQFADDLPEAHLQFLKRRQSAIHTHGATVQSKIAAATMATLRHLPVDKQPASSSPPSPPSGSPRGDNTGTITQSAAPVAAPTAGMVQGPNEALNKARLATVFVHLFDDQAVAFFAFIEFVRFLQRDTPSWHEWTRQLVQSVHKIGNEHCKEVWGNSHFSGLVQQSVVDTFLSALVGSVFTVYIPLRTQLVLLDVVLIHGAAFIPYVLAALFKVANMRGSLHRAACLADLQKVVADLSQDSVNQALTRAKEWYRLHTHPEKPSPAVVASDKPASQPQHPPHQRPSGGSAGQSGSSTSREGHARRMSVAKDHVYHGHGHGHHDKRPTSPPQMFARMVKQQSFFPC
eukprot:TRINITY_DN17483_c0_g1_i1.p1 TRINITY_DN17483_c0_g1~~TRINITY_DN17483_c0_g1_i1.p1  ORF type:complete len:474 (+),score=68.36 TRINITY_DN17483_c0_g1_i1:34-1455(+)